MTLGAPAKIVGMVVATALLATVASALRPTSTLAQTEIRKQSTESAHAKGTASTSAAQAPMAAAAAKLNLSNLVVSERGGLTVIQLAAAGVGRLRLYALGNPDRVVIEGERLGFAPDLAASVLPPGRDVTDFRYGSLDNGDGRLVFDATRPVRLVSATNNDGQIILELSTDGLRTSDEPRVLEIGTGTAVGLSQPSGPAWAASTVAARRVIMLDPGHGGKDPGAITEAGLYEKVIVLAVAQRLAAVLGVRGYDVRMTRDGDQSVPLDRRVQLARAARADLFLSLHADTFAGQPQAASVRGGAVYVLADKASSRTAETLARRENAADKRLGADALMSAQDPAVDAFLSDLTERETRTFAAAAQTALVGSLRQVMQLARDPARGAAFRVLKQADVPSVLIELGYMSHAEDVARLQSADWQLRVAEAIARAVDAYFAAPRSAVSAR